MPSHHPLYALLFASACASTGSLGGEREPAAPHARVELAPLQAEPGMRILPQAIDPQLPTADRIWRVIDARLGDEARIDVRFCVSPAGRVVEATLERGSSYQPFDQAVMADIADWRFAAQPGPESVRTCDRATIVYRPHRT